MATAGQLLVQMLITKEKGEDTREIQKEFEEQSKRQLGGFCTEFSVETEIKESEE